MLVSAIVAGVLAGVLRGGDLRQLGNLRVKWLALLLVALAARVFAAVPTEEGLQRSVYVLSLWLLLAAVLVNLFHPGARLIALGVGLNALVISLNGGAMPVAAWAAESPSDPLHRPMDSATVLPWLGDLIPFPPGGAYSAGDLLLGGGVFLLVYRTMRRG